MLDVLCHFQGYFDMSVAGIKVDRCTANFYTDLPSGRKKPDFCFKTEQRFMVGEFPAKMPLNLLHKGVATAVFFH